MCGEGTRRSADVRRRRIRGQTVWCEPRASEQLVFYKRLGKQQSLILTLDLGAGFLALAMPFVEHCGTRGFIPSKQLGLSTNQLLVIEGGWDCCLVNTVYTAGLYQWLKAPRNHSWRKWGTRAGHTGADWKTAVSNWEWRKRCWRQPKRKSSGSHGEEGRSWKFFS